MMREFVFADKKRLVLGGRPLIMGILNLAPDSFSDGDADMTVKRAVDKLLELTAAGADIIDIGAESTRPGAKPLAAKEEIARLKPILPAIIQKSLLPVSIDTYHAETAEFAAELGVHMINDVCEGGAPATIKTAARFNLPMVIMHNGRRDLSSAGGIMDCVKDFFRRALYLADEANLPRRNVIFDPGIGFGKDTAENLLLINRLNELKEINGEIYPMLLGASRKRFIGDALGLPTKERDEATGAACVVGMMRGADILRVHNVRVVGRMCRMAHAILTEQNFPVEKYNE